MITAHEIIVKTQKVTSRYNPTTRIENSIQIKRQKKILGKIKKEMKRIRAGIEYRWCECRQRRRGELEFDEMRQHEAAKASTHEQHVSDPNYAQSSTPPLTPHLFSWSKNEAEQWVLAARQRSRWSGSSAWNWSLGFRTPDLSCSMRQLEEEEGLRSNG